MFRTATMSQPCRQRLTPVAIAMGDEFTDLQVKCEGSTFFVHKVLVCNASPVLHKAMTGCFKVNFTLLFPGILYVQS